MAISATATWERPNEEIINRLCLRRHRHVFDRINTCRGRAGKALTFQTRLLSGSYINLTLLP